MSNKLSDESRAGVFSKQSQVFRLKGVCQMKVIQVELPDKITAELESLVKEGWFTDETEIIRLAVMEFVRRDRLTLQEQFQREDIAWALKQKGLAA
jgi:Arc/MetJ-type ribon-helix-helix transcriptional regulator